MLLKDMSDSLDTRIAEIWICAEGTAEATGVLLSVVVRPCPKHHGTVARAAAVEAFAGFVLHHPCEAQAALAH
eukprot:s15485_g1.t1